MRPAHSSGSVMSSGRSCVSKSIIVSASSVHREHAGGDALWRSRRTPDRGGGEQAAQDLDDRIAGRDRRLARAAPAASASHDMTGMFSSAVIRCPHAGTPSAGRRGCRRARRGSSSPRSSAHCACQPRSSIFGSRWMTTFRKLPTHRPTTSARRRASAGSLMSARRAAGEASRRAARCQARRSVARSTCRWRRTGASDDRAELEDRQVHRDDEAADDDARGTR